MKLIVPVESLQQNLGGVILYDPIKNRIIKQYVHKKEWRRCGWRGGVIHNNHLIATDWTELHYFNIKKWKYRNSFTKNTFNDLHYLIIKENNLYVVNTGIDAIEIFEDPMQPKFKDIHFLFEKNSIFKQRKIDLKASYNQMYKMKHSCHPNCILVTDEHSYVTCFENHTREKKSGTIVELETGRLIVQGFNCHDGILFKGDYYLSSTRENSILVIKDFKNKVKQNKLPLMIDDTIRIGSKGWWRGMVIHDDKIYIFASYGYGVDRPCKMAIVNLKERRVKLQNLPIVDGVKWDSVYQPNII